MQSSKNKQSLIFLFGALLIAGLATLYFWQIGATSSTQFNQGKVEVIIPDGLRKEQTALILADKLDWSDEEIKKFIEKDTALDLMHVEGTYPGGTYQIPETASTYEVAQLLLEAADARKEKLGPNLHEEAWWQVLKIAAIVEREAESETDMPNIAARVWRQVSRNQKLESDATVQYVRDSIQNYASSPCHNDLTSGMVEYEYPAEKERPARIGCIHWRLAYIGTDEDFDWWQPITEADKELEHGFNTYLYEGLPAQPIATPSEAAIRAVLNDSEAHIW